MCRHQRHTSEPPRREDVGAFVRVALDGGPRRRLGGLEVAAQHLEARQRDEVERIVPARPRLGFDELVRSSDRAVELVELASQPVLDPVGAVVLPGSAVLH